MFASKSQFSKINFEPHVLTVVLKTSTPFFWRHSQQHLFTRRMRHTSNCSTFSKDWNFTCVTELHNQHIRPISRHMNSQMKFANTTSNPDYVAVLFHSSCISNANKTKKRGYIQWSSVMFWSVHVTINYIQQCLLEIIISQCRYDYAPRIKDLWVPPKRSNSIR